VLSIVDNNSSLNRIFNDSLRSLKSLERSFIVVIVTTANREEAEKIARNLLEEKLVACANIIGSVSSLFLWTGKIEHADEHVVLMKSRKDLFEKLAKKVKALHSYEVPEIVALPIVECSQAYMEWLDSLLR
jgi:periplasmic divalent cation tolerance protein